MRHYLGFPALLQAVLIRFAVSPPRRQAGWLSWTARL